jgi:hypothetical protein
MGILGENYENDAKAFAAFLTPQYVGQIEFVPIGNTLNGGTPPIRKVLQLLPATKDKYKLDALLCMLDLDTDLATKWAERRKWFTEISKGTNLKSVFFLAVMELEALILADIDTFNKIFTTSVKYTNNPKAEPNPKAKLRTWTERSKAKRQYAEKDALEIFKKLDFETVYKKNKGEDSFQAFIDNLDKQFKVLCLYKS